MDRRKKTIIAKTNFSKIQLRSPGSWNVTETWSKTAFNEFVDYHFLTEATSVPTFLCNFSFCFTSNSLKGPSSLSPTQGKRWIWDTAYATRLSLKAVITNNFWIKKKLYWMNSKQSICPKNKLEKQPTWMCILMTAFPMSVAPKKVQKGTRKWPHVMPAKSKSGFGIWKSHNFNEKCSILGWN